MCNTQSFGFEGVGPNIGKSEEGMEKKKQIKPQIVVKDLNNADRTTHRKWRLSLDHARRIGSHFHI